MTSEAFMKILAAALLLAASPCAAQYSPKPGKTAEASAVVVPQAGAAVAEVVGVVEAPQGAAWAKLARGQSVAPGTQVRVGPKSSALLIFPDASKVQVSADTTFTLEAATRKDVGLFVNSGTLQAWVTKLKGRSFKIRSSAAVAAVRGTTLRYVVLPGGQVRIDLFTGKVDVSDAFGRFTQLEAGERLTADKNGSKTEDLPPSTDTPSEPKVEYTLAANKTGSETGTADSEPSETEKTEDTKDDSTVPPPPDKNPAQDVKIDDKPLVSPSAPSNDPLPE
jgi:hypothetical protein